MKLSKILICSIAISMLCACDEQSTVVQQKTDAEKQAIIATPYVPPIPDMSAGKGKFEMPKSILHK